MLPTRACEPPLTLAAYRLLVALSTYMLHGYSCQLLPWACAGGAGAGAGAGTGAGLGAGAGAGCWSSSSYPHPY
ncbi:hypothetical protein COCC4DRAFT_41320 [Bipolaris maydis ATCC 48331]|uniref:Uncharacterized protein n=2 Tax=Cochliobolus heterostrophus TaxID=5016 RepID=M2SP57_COCH5|nr:uncharacterized protein COCC4DRAFT_41320 [Bipolaris maydis ATCC 48331]EMD87115.1 hypothetical protein COCHEDRAFT_1218089 [Bipolaris maydis C5]ENI03891.1 hypothetical protein COCC4DRAFT_41320 [Bipolaris maydis ATCC 48331]KAJ6192845.1 hypothetical protein J3E72DRAFT_379213 [Bipolaris maydis]